MAEAPVVATKPKVVLLTWKPARPWVIHLAQSGGLIGAISKSQDPKAVLTKEEAEQAMREFKPLMIIPNTNEYPLAQWELVKNHPDVKRMLADGQLVIETKGALGQVIKEGETPETPAEKLPATLDKIEVAKARDLADNCDNMELLERWLKTELAGQNRSSVIDSIKNKIDILKDTDARFKGEASGNQN